tara:strand:+ start:422 stop:571 length:150 start_codon:yes stop_codon:yes gene_type:complete
MEENKIEKLTLGEFIKKRLEEENISWEDLDIDTIDFFYQQWLIDSNMGL